MAYSLRSVAKGAGIYTVGQSLIKAAGFMLIPLYTRFLTPQDYGIVGYLEVFRALMATLLMFGFYGAQTRFYYAYKDDPHKTGEFLFSINVFLFWMVLAISLLLSVAGEALFNKLSRNPDVLFYPFFLIIIWTVFFQTLNQMAIQYEVAAKAYKSTVLLECILFALSTLLVIYFVVSQKQGALGQIKGVLYAQIVFFTVVYLRYARNFRLQLSLAYIKDALAFGLPIVVHLLSSNILLLIDRVILERYVSLSALGLYTLGYQIGLGMSVLVTSINRAWKPNYFELMNQKNVDRGFEMRKAFSIWLTGVGLVCLVGALWSKEIIVLLTPRSYHPSAVIVPIIMLSALFEGLYFFSANTLFYYKKTILLPFITASAALLNIGFNMLLIPRFGIYGAAYATLVSHMFLASIVYLIGRRLFNPRFELKKTVALVLLISTSLWTGFQEFTVLLEVSKSVIVMIYVISCLVLFQKYLQPQKYLRGDLKISDLF